MKTFANLPLVIETAISNILSTQETSEWVSHAGVLHEQYVSRENSHGRISLKSFDDTLAYLALRVPATYAQTYSALADIQALVPSWQPKNVLDLGSGPGTGSWAAKEVWPSISESSSVDQHNDFLMIGKQIQTSAQLEITMHWQQYDLRGGIDQHENKYDVVLIANVLNELSPAAADKLIGQALNSCRGVVVIIEPGTPFGYSMTENAAKKLSKAGLLLAPYIQNTFVPTNDYYLHFPQRLIRPDFQRRIRQHMRETTLMASDWEETKYAYTVISKIPSEITPWGRCIGPVKTQKGFLEIPVLTKDGIEKVKVLKRHNQQYTFAKDRKWGELIMNRSDLIITSL